RWVGATARLQSATESKFGPHEEKESNVAQKLVHALAVGARAKFVVINDDEASVASGQLLDDGYVLHRAGNRWKVVSLAATAQHAESTVQFLAQASSACDVCQAELDRGNFATYEHFVTRYNELFRAAFEGWVHRLVDAQPTTQRSTVSDSYR